MHRHQRRLSGAGCLSLPSQLPYLTVRETAEFACFNSTVRWGHHCS